MKISSSLLSGVLCISLLISGCNNEFDVNDDWQDITVVYGLLNWADTAHYVKVTKAFLGEANAYDMANVSDSLYYKNISVSIQEWNNNNLVRTLTLFEDTTIPRDEGIFASDRNLVYKTTGQLNQDYMYRLVILKNGTEITSETMMIKDFYISLPGQASLYSASSTMKISWLSPVNSKIFEPGVRFHYYEVTQTDTVKKYIDIPLSTQYSLNSAGGENMEALLTGGQFQSNLQNKIPQDNAVIKRIVAEGSINTSVFTGSEDMYTYIQVNMPATGIVTEKPAFSNISGGLGIFTSRFYKESLKIQLTQRTIDSLSKSNQTSFLKFLDYAQTKSLWDGTGFQFP